MVFISASYLLIVCNVFPCNIYYKSDETKFYEYIRHTKYLRIRRIVDLCGPFY